MLNQLTLMAIVTGTLLGQQVQAQEKNAPFGIYMGMPISALDWVDKDEEYGSYELGAPPAPDSQLRQYFVTYTEATGVCGVMALTQDVPAEKATEIFEYLSPRLENEQGITVADEYTEILEGIENRVVELTWHSEQLPPDLDDVQNITLRNNALASSSNTVFLYYQFANYEECVTGLPIYSKLGSPGTEPAIPQ